MRSLERLVLCGVYADSRRIFDRYFLALSLLPNLKSLNILTNQGFKGDHLKELNLEELSTDIGMTTPQWIAFLKSNPKLRSLQFRVCRIIPEKPADLVPYCTSLEELYIWFKSKCDSYDYGAFAQLPNLKHLHIIGKYQQTDSTVQLFRSLVARDPQLLESLSIKRGMLTFDETQEIVHIKSLKELNCSFSDIECVDLLTQLTELEELSILLKSDTDISNAALRILKSCTKLKLFRIYAENIRRDFIFEAYNILKEIREPSKQPPLSLEVPYGKFALMKPEEERRIDPAYIRIDPKHAA
ncbi:uncharacterized protein LOC115625860 [Scaptodrosophila lebanonensis]|uniref:Uncharacterized protein LOC115625860 n=1 Tax=Drosophila lebanonensis TaxID=7225 RepID=A0A6J2TP82_DROLE|nr:uncharacterized protein LOC115625860 [Scaptodrosophila lebanonensis]